jgi:hypothetical protein
MFDGRTVMLLIVIPAKAGIHLDFGYFAFLRLVETEQQQDQNGSRLAPG